MRTLVAIPTYNELQSLPRTLDAIFAHSPEVEVLVIDDGSPDGTAEYALERAEADPRIHVLERTEKNGLGAAYLAGFAWALERDYEIVCEMDADGSHRGTDLPQLLAAVERGADLAIGSRWVPGGAVVNWPKNREALSRGASIYANAAIGLHVSDPTAGFRAYRRRTLEAIDLDGVESLGYCFQIDLTRRVRDAGLSIEEIPIVFVEREEGESKMSGNIISEAFVRVGKWGIEKRTRQLRGLFSRKARTGA